MSKTGEKTRQDIERFWSLPKVTHGTAQVPYLYDQEANAFLNRAVRLAAKGRPVNAAAEAALDARFTAIVDGLFPQESMA